MFNLLVVNIEMELERDGMRGVQVGREKLRVLEYTDDVVILAEDEEGIK